MKTKNITNKPQSHDQLRRLIAQTVKPRPIRTPAGHAEQELKEWIGLAFLLGQDLSPLQSDLLGYLKRGKFGHFLTLTANFPISKKYLTQKVEKYFRNILASIPRKYKRTPVEFFYSLEKNLSLDGGYHVHGLLKLSAAVTDTKMLGRQWNMVMNDNGTSNFNHQTSIQEPRNLENAAAYVVKKITHINDSYDYLTSTAYSNRKLTTSQKPRPKRGLKNRERTTTEL